MKSAKNVLTNNLNEYLLSDEKLQLLKDVELEIFDDVYQACRKRKIPFYLMHGTMLGAVRHQGFIPWDDDIDTAAYLEDFDKIKAAILEDYPNKYEFAGLFENYHQNAFFALKVMLKGSKAIEINAENNPDPRGIFIDIFPIFKVSQILKKRQKMYKKMSFYRHVGALAFEYKYPPTTLLKQGGDVEKYYKKRRLMGMLCAPFYLWSRKKLLKNYHRYDKQDTGYYAINIAIGLKNDYGITQEILSQEREYQFENHRYLSLANYDYLLKAQYGDNYMTLPPLEKRERHMMLDVKR